MPAFESFRAARWLRTVNLVLQAVLFLTLFGGLNYLAGHHPFRLDLTRYRRFSLSPETLAYLKELSQPVRIVVTSSEDEADPSLRGLLREYAYASEANPEGRITVEYLDIYQNRRRVEELGIDRPGLVVLFCGEQRHALAADELYRYDDGREAFRGEQALTAALLDVSSPDRKKIYFLAGHGELRPDDVDPMRGLSVARDELRLRNFDVDTLDLTRAREIPADASLLVAVEPRSAYTAYEQDLLRQYLSDSDGRLILFLAPGLPYGLERLCRDWGVKVDDDLLCDTGTDNVTEEGDFIIRRFLPHPITQALIQSHLALRIGPARTVHPDPASALSNGVDVATLAVSSPTAWGEVGASLRGAAVFNPRIDLRPLPDRDPPDGLGLAVASERAAARDNLPFSVRRGRLVVFGTGDLISNSRIANAGVIDLLRGAAYWAVNRDSQLNIPARPIERFQLSLSAGELRRLRLCLLVFLPGAAALIGLGVYWTRRR